MIGTASGASASAATLTLALISRISRRPPEWCSDLSAFLRVGRGRYSNGARCVGEYSARGIDLHRLCVVDRSTEYTSASDDTYPFFDNDLACLHLSQVRRVLDSLTMARAVVSSSCGIERSSIHGSLFLSPPLPI